MSELLWVSVPAGRVHDGRPRLRVVVVPRLKEELAKVGMADWPKVLENAKLSVEVVSGGVIREIGHRAVGLGRSDAWHALFDQVDVRSFDPRPRYEKPTVTATSEHAGRVLGTYETSAHALASAGPDADQVVADELSGWDEPEEVIQAPPLRRPGAEPPDFHRVVALLREHPTVLRALGLIIELELSSASEAPAAALPRSSPAHPAMIKVSWPRHPLGARIVPLWTSYEFDGEMFLPAGTGDIRAGLLDLTGVKASAPGTRDPDEPIKWEVATVDVDGAVARLRDAARAGVSRPAPARRRGDDGSGFAMRRSDRAPEAKRSPVAFPALRSGGLLLLRRQREHDLVPREPIDVTHVDIENEPIVGVPQMSAADLVLGYRVDVERQGEDRWRSLTERETTYFLGGGAGTDPVTITPDTGVEEGHLKSRSMARNADERDDAEDDEERRRARMSGLRSDEVVARWTGWSLAVPRPIFDRSVSRRTPQRLVGLPLDRFDRVLRLDWTMAPPRGSLPMLRFGTQYRLRVRIADIAGSGLELDDVTGHDGATELIAYQRYEPVAPPTVPPPPGFVDEHGQLRPEIVGPGGAADRLVVRSDPAGDGDVGAHLPANDKRSILPPTTTFDVIEQWGVLDEADETTWERAARAMKLTKDGIPEAESADAVPDLPDPAAAGITAFLHDIDDEAGAGQLVDKDWNPWPTGGERTVHLVAGSPASAPEVDWQGTTLVVSLPPAGEAVLELSSFLRLDELGRFAIKRPLPAAGEDLAVAGRHPMVTPAHTLRLVHAVRRPLRDPRGAFDTVRGPGETTARLRPPEGLPLLDLDPASTLQLDVIAEWDDVVDDPEEESSRIEHRAVALPPVVITRDAVALPELRLELGDTRNRLVTYKAAATGRFREFFDDAGDDEAFVARSTLGQASARNTARPPAPVVLSAVPGFMWSGREVPTGWSRTVGSRLVRVRLGRRIHLELARPWFLTGEGETLGVLAVDDSEGATAPTPEMRPCTSQVARDRVYDAISQPPVPPDRWVTAGMLPGPGSVDVVAVPEVVPVRFPNTAAIRAYDVSYADRRCFADIEITNVADHLYCPLVQLVVARYQRGTLEGLPLLSPVVKTDFVPLLPDRKLVIERVAAGLQITLEGLGPASNVGRRNRVDAHLERLEAPTDVPLDAVDLAALGPDASGLPAWTRVAGAAVTGGLGSPLPILAIPAGPGRFRLVVKEVERFFVDDFGTIVEPPPGGDLTERIVFTDIVNLT
jgi:hypothetical protein